MRNSSILEKKPHKNKITIPVSVFWPKNDWRVCTKARPVLGKPDCLQKHIWIMLPRALIWIYHSSEAKCKSEEEGGMTSLGPGTKRHPQTPTI